MNPWKDLLSKIFPGADAEPAPEECIAPEDKPDDPAERIHAMRKIRGSSGFARLYGAKDVEQFVRQAEYMRDFADDYPKDIPFGDSMPTYADMSLAQLRCYFTWRTQARAGDWRGTSYAYVLVYIYELLNTHESPERIVKRLARCWLAMRGEHPKLDAQMPQWLKDYYVCHAFPLPFGELTASLGLEALLPVPSQKRGLLSLSSYSARDSRFLREMPAYAPILDAAANAAVVNLKPLFTLHGVNEEETFFMKPARFSFYELYRDAAALPPAQHGASEVRISYSEIYRMRGGNWSRAAEDAFRPPSHAVGYVVKRLEAELRRLAGFTAPWNDPEAGALRERWLQADPRALPLTEDPRLPAILAETARRVCDPAAPAPFTEALARALEQEPLRTILALRETSGFVRQGKKLARLEDDSPETAPYSSLALEYAEMTHAQLRTYLTWRTKYRKGIIERADTAYVLLYIRELEHSIGTAQPLEDLCRLLRGYAPLDKTVARRLPERIGALGRSTPGLPALLAEQGVQAWFPEIFLFGPCAQLPVFDQLAAYHITASRFYKPAQAELFNACFDQVLRACEQAFRQANLSLHTACQGPPAPALAGFLLKRMEQRLRERVRYPYSLRANPVQMVCPALKGRNRLRAFLATGALTAAIDAAVDEFAQINDLSPLAGVRRQGGGVRPPAPSLPAEPPPPPPEVKIDFALLPEIRAQANALTELLIVEDDGEPVGAAILPPGSSQAGGMHAAPTAFTPEQIAILAYLSAGEGNPNIDDIAVEAINEIALETIGDTLIEAHENGYKIIEEYRESWKEQ